VASTPITMETDHRATRIGADHVATKRSSTAATQIARSGPQVRAPIGS